MDRLFIALLFACGALALAGPWLAKRPNLAAAADRWCAVHAFAGIALLGLALWTWLRAGVTTLFKAVALWPVGGSAVICAVIGGVTLGALLGLPRPRPGPRTAWYWPVAGLVAVYAGVMLVLIRIAVVVP